MVTREGVKGDSNGINLGKYQQKREKVALCSYERLNLWGKSPRLQIGSVFPYATPKRPYRRMKDLVGRKLYKKKTVGKGTERNTKKDISVHGDLHGVQGKKSNET